MTACPQCAGAPCEIQAACEVCNGSGHAPGIKVQEIASPWSDVIWTLATCNQLSEVRRLLGREIDAALAPFDFGITSGPQTSPRPELRSMAAEQIGREGLVTVWDDQGRYLGCMGIETWSACKAQV